MTTEMGTDGWKPGCKVALILSLGIAAVFGGYLSVLIKQRRFDEREFLQFVETQYIPDYYRSHHSIPRSLDGMDAYCENISEEGVTGRERQVFDESKPTLNIVLTDPKHYRGRMKFTWAFGSIYDMSMPIDPYSSIAQ